MSNGEDGMYLTYNEAVSVARRIVARHAADAAEWLDWEDYPNLGEYSFDRLVIAVQEVGHALGVEADHHDRADEIDSSYLISKAVT